MRKSQERDDRQALSLPAQERELTELAQRQGISRTELSISESMSAKTPGRPGFAKMLDQLQKGRAEGIICWHLDRLARNPLDGGALMWALGQGVIKEIVTPGRTYTGTGDDKLMMSIIFGMATKYSDDISVNVKRGLKEALLAGKWPASPKLGYVRDHATNLLLPDPSRWELVRDMWHLRVNGMPVTEIVRRANDEWGFRTPQRGKQGGGKLSLTRAYAILEDPFYAGAMVFDGETFRGAHAPMVTVEQLERVKAMRRASTWSPSEHENLPFTYRGLVRCGECKAGLTSESTTNRWGSTYVYYHCCRKKRPDRYCPQPSIEERDLERQLGNFLESVTLPSEIVDFAIGELQEMRATSGQRAKEARARIQGERQRTVQRLDRLTGLLVDGVLGETDYAVKRDNLVRELVKLDEQLAATNRGVAGDLEPLESAFILAKNAKQRFESAVAEDKRALVQAFVSNLELSDRKLNVFAKKPFCFFGELGRISGWLGVREQVTTLIERVLVG